MSVIQLSNGDVEVINTPNDFIDLVDKHLGMDARNWVSDLVSNYEFKIEMLEEEEKEN